MAIIRAASFDEAREVAESEPFHQGGLCTNTVTGWQLNEGSFTVRVRYSAREFDIA